MNKIKQFLRAVVAALAAPIAAYAERTVVLFAYRGSTELSSVSNPPRCITAGMWGLRASDAVGSSKLVGQNVWLYNTTDSCTDLVTAGYFTDAYYIGMKRGDLIMGSFTTGSSVSAYMGVIGAVTTSGANIDSSGSQIRSQ